MKEETIMLYKKYIYYDESLNYLSTYEFLRNVINNQDIIRKFINDKYDFIY